MYRDYIHPQHLEIDKRITTFQKEKYIFLQVHMLLYTKAVHYPLQDQFWSKQSGGSNRYEYPSDSTK